MTLSSPTYGHRVFRVTGNNPPSEYTLVRATPFSLENTLIRTFSRDNRGIQDPHDTEREGIIL